MNRQRNLLLLLVSIACASAICIVVVFTSINSTQDQLQKSQPGGLNQLGQIDNLLDRSVISVDQLLSLDHTDPEIATIWAQAQLEFDLLWASTRIFDLKQPGAMHPMADGLVFHDNLEQHLDQYEALYSQEIAPADATMLLALKTHLQSLDRQTYELSRELFNEMGFYRDDLRKRVGKLDSLLKIFGLLFLLSAVLAFLLLAQAKRHTDASIAEIMLTKKRLEMALQEVRSGKREKQERDSFLAAASHDLRQPLHALGLFLSALEKHVGDQTGKDVLNKAQQSTEALKQLLNSLLDLSRLDAGVVEVDNRHFQVADMFRRFENDCYEIGTLHGVDVQIRHSGCVARSDPLLLSRILKNLIENAIFHSGSDKVIVDCQNRGQYLTLSVIDFGIGIPVADQANVFSEYFQVDNAERDRLKGLGLGLSIVERLCNLLDIKLEMSSKPGKGTRFKLVLPAGDPARVGPEETSEPVSPVRLYGLSIVVIDDDKEVREAMKTMLAEFNVNALCAESAEEARAQIVEHDLVPDILIVDYRLKAGKTGIEAIELIREELNQETPAIIVTGDTSPERVREISSGGYHLMHKPVGSRQLLESVSRLTNGTAGSFGPADRDLQYITEDNINPASPKRLN